MHRATHVHSLIIRIKKFAVNTPIQRTEEEVSQYFNTIITLARCALDGVEPCPTCDASGIASNGINRCWNCKGTGIKQKGNG